MIKKLVQHGNSSALIIDKLILELLKIDGDTSLELSTDGSSIIISPVRDTKRLTRIKSALDDINKKHQTTLENLAR